MSSITTGDRGGVPSRINYISLEQFTLLPLAGPRTVGISKGRHFFYTSYKNFQASTCSHFRLFGFASLALTLFPSRSYDGNMCLILGHSFIRSLREYLGRNVELDANLHILEGIKLKWHGVGGKTVLKVIP